MILWKTNNYDYIKLKLINTIFDYLAALFVGSTIYNKSIKILLYRTI